MPSIYHFLQIRLATLYKPLKPKDRTLFIIIIDQQELKPISMSLLFSGIVILGVILVFFVIYILFTLAWHLYRSQLLSAPTLSQEDPIKEKCFSYRKLKPDVITFNYKKELSDGPNQEEENSDKNNECVVCLRGLQNEEFVRQLPKCKHTFHAPCIDMWLYSHSDCPICRKEIDRLPPDEGVLTPGRKSQEVSVDISPSLTLTTTSIIQLLILILFFYFVDFGHSLVLSKAKGFRSCTAIIQYFRFHASEVTKSSMVIFPKKKSSMLRSLSLTQQSQVGKKWLRVQTRIGFYEK